MVVVVVVFVVAILVVVVSVNGANIVPTSISIIVTLYDDDVDDIPVLVVS